MRFHPRALVVMAIFWATLFIARDVRWGVAAVAAAGAIDWAFLVLPLVPGVRVSLKR